MKRVRRFIASHILLIAVSMFLTNIATYPSESTKTMPDSSQIEDSELPKNYRHLPPLTQINNYRTIYNQAKNVGISNNIDLEPVDGLFSVLKNGFSLVYDTIDGNYPQFIEGKESTEEEKDLKDYWDKIRARNDKEKYLNSLKSLWKRIKEYMADKNDLNVREFLAFNTELARHIDSFKEGSAINEKDLNNLIKYTSDIPALFIVYGNPNPVKFRHINREHFVREFCNSDYIGYISFFDTLSYSKTGKQRSKKDPHWSLYNGTYKMLLHDVVHNKDQWTSFGRKYQAIVNKNLKEICKIRDDYIKDKDENTALIITNALFEWTHELPTMTDNDCIDKSIKDCIIALTDNSKKRYKKNVKKDFGSDYYKRFSRDKEGVIKSTFGPDKNLIHDETNTPFYNYNPNNIDETNDEIKKELKKEALLDGYERYWNYVQKLCLEKVPE